MKRGVGKTTLQALCRNAGYYIPKPAHIRCGTTFASRKNLSNEAKRYCMRDVASLRILYNQYKDMPILTKRLEDEEIELQMHVDVMPQLRSATAPIAQGIIVPSDGAKAVINKKWN